MIGVEYAAATSIAEALAAVAEDGASVIAGGTELLNWIRLGIVEPARLVDIHGLTGLVGSGPDADIRVEGDALRIGALATLNEIGAHPLVELWATTLGEACLAAASAQIRNRASLGGNVLQKTRCPYFRAEAPLPWGCNKRVPGSGCSAAAGVNVEAALFGWTQDCAATQPSDPAAALSALDASFELVSRRGIRSVPAAEFFLTQQDAAGVDPSCAATLENVLQPDELVAAVRVPLAPDSNSAYVKVRERQSYAYALVSAAAVVQVRDGVVTRAAIALGSAAQRPWRLGQLEAELVGRPVDADLEAFAMRAAEQAMADARPLPDNEYKVTMARTAAVRALLQAVTR